MNRILFLALMILSATLAAGADSAPTQLVLHTQDDDLRAGGTVAFVLKMRDGSEQVTALVSNERLADNSSKTFRVAPNAPYSWGDVAQWGLRVAPHRGDGALLQPDQWKVYVVLSGRNRSCPPTLQPGSVCFVNANARWHFQRTATELTAFGATVGQCRNDADCVESGEFCGTRTMACTPRAAGANFMGCARLPSPRPACAAGMACNEQTNSCVAAGCADADKDGDGVDSVECGGTDCDDNDRSRYPGAAEVCDNQGKDEDCDLTTIGKRDQDNDGFVDAACWNDRRGRR